MKPHLSNHARLRQIERALPDEDIAAALAGRVVEGDAQTWHYDNRTRTVVIVSSGKVVTIYRMHRKQVKRLLSR